MDKTTLRTKYTLLRSGLSPEHISTLSRAVAQNLVSTINLDGRKTAHVYTSLGLLGEVDTTVVAASLRTAFPDLEMTMSTAGKDSPIPDSQYDVVIVPLLAFDDTLHRLGFGGGWYDRFLASQSIALKIGLAYESQYAAMLPVESHDIPLDLVVTDMAVRRRASED